MISSFMIVFNSSLYVTNFHYQQLCLTPPMYGCHTYGDLEGSEGENNNVQLIDFKRVWLDVWSGQQKII